MERLEAEACRPSLTEADFERIGRVFDKRVHTLFETIGYDVTTPESRARIRDDHTFIRRIRRASGLILTGLFTAIGSGVLYAAVFGVK